MIPMGYTFMPNFMFILQIMRTHLAYLSYISAFQAGFCGLAGILYISLSTFRSIFDETVIIHKFQCLERPMAPQKLIIVEFLVWEL